MDVSSLEEIGLTGAEIKVYLALVEMGSVKAAAILQKSGLQNSVVHLTLAKLTKKGLVSFVRRGAVRYYQSCDPRYLLRFLEEKKLKFEKVLPQLLSLQQPYERQEAEVFEGLSGFKAMLYSFIEDAEPGDDYLFFSFHPGTRDRYPEVFEFYKEFEKERQRRGLIVRGIAPKELQNFFAGRAVENVLFVDFPTVLNLSVCRNKVVMTPWEDDRQISFLVTSRHLSSNFRQYFYSIWNHYQGEKP
jgi:sugar-specific transcriptional regulator TrmB